VLSPFALFSLFDDFIALEHRGSVASGVLDGNRSHCGLKIPMNVISQG
jgi:hypothetical protein